MTLRQPHLAANAAKVAVAAMTAVALLAGTGCSVMRDQQSVGTYVDDSVLTTRVKSKFAAASMLALCCKSVGVVPNRNGGPVGVGGGRSMMDTMFARNLGPGLKKSSGPTS